MKYLVIYERGAHNWGHSPPIFRATPRPLRASKRFGGSFASEFHFMSRAYGLRANLFRNREQSSSPLRSHD